ncbi:MAG: SEC-C metal-binding domain-containing protein [Promethearchaeota archaeon]|jgi:uncharacterized protein YecA (UPF0149 family)
MKKKDKNKTNAFRDPVSNIRDNLPSFKRGIDKKVTSLLSIINEFEPLELLHAIAAENIFYDPEKYKEMTHEGKETRVEYALSTILGCERKPNYKHPTEDAINEFKRLINEILNDALWYFLYSSLLDNKTETEKDLRTDTLGRFLFVRGDSIAEHHLEMIKGLFGQHDDFFKSHFKFTTTEFLSAVDNMEKQITANLNNFREYIKLGRSLHEKFLRFLKNKQIQNKFEIEELFTEFNSIDEVRPVANELDNIAKTISLNIFEIHPETDLRENLLSLLASQFGDNSEFILFEKSPCWPTNDSIILQKPLVKNNDRYFCFSPTLLFRNISVILENLIKTNAYTYFITQYQSKRASYLEKMALDYFKVLLPNTKIYSKLYYLVVENGNEKRVETDGLILYDNNIFIIEAKAGSFSRSARRGSVEKIKENLKELMGTAYNQAIRTKKYIASNANPSFEYEDGTMALTINNKDNYQYIFIINVTLENLSGLSTQLHSIRKLGLIEGKEWPWSVFINDLKIISELCESPSIFIHYLKSRIGVNEVPKFHSPDELDYFMHYLMNGLHGELDPEFNRADKVYIVGFTAQLERYYDFKAGRVKSGSKPKINIPNIIKKIIFDLDNVRDYGFTTVTSILLEISNEGMKRIGDGLWESEKLHHNDNKGHKITVPLGDSKYLLVIAVFGKNDKDYIEHLIDYCQFKMYHTKRKNCILLKKIIVNSNEYKWEFKIFEKEWSFDPVMENRIVGHKKVMLKEFKKGKINRNARCPCRSGLKYKHCCGK